MQRTRYDYLCPQGHVVELALPMDERNLAHKCPEHGDVMGRQFATPMAIAWEGKFGNRWAKVRDGDW